MKTKEQLITEILNNRTYAPSSKLIFGLKRKLQRWSHSDLQALALVIALK